MLKVKVLKNGLGEYAIWWGVESPNEETKCTHLAYKRFFKDKSKADKWAERFTKKMLNK